jgi:hypothetical protein
MAAVPGRSTESLDSMRDDIDHLTLGDSPRIPTNGIRRSRIAVMLLPFLVALLPAVAHAVDDRLSFTQAPDGSVIATLSGAVPYCSYAFTGSQLSIVGSTVNIISATVIADCPPPPPGFVAPPPSPYSVSVNLGVLADGSYSVTWSFAGPQSLQPLLGAFRVQGGALIDPFAVPTLSPIAYFLLLGLLAIYGRRHLKRQSDWHAV